MPRPLIFALTLSALAHALLLSRPVWHQPAAPADAPPALLAQLTRRPALAPRPAPTPAAATPIATSAAKTSPRSPPQRVPAVNATPPLAPVPDASANGEPSPSPPDDEPAAAAAGESLASPARVADGRSAPATKRVQPGENEVRWNNDLAAFRQAVAQAARELKRYPAAARARGQTGSVTIVVRAVASADAVAVPDASIARSSGTRLLDEAALALIEQAIAVTELPPALRGRAFEFVLPIEYALSE